MTFATIALAVARKDLMSEWRTRELVPALAQFVVLAVVIANFGFQFDSRNGPAIAPGVLWMALVFAGLVAFGRAFAAEREQSSLDAMLLTPASPAAIFAGKAVAAGLLLVVCEAVLLPALALFFSVPLSLEVLSAVLLATVGMAVLGCLFAAMVARVRARELLLPLLTLPLWIPVMSVGADGGHRLLGEENRPRRSTRTCRGGGGPCFHDGDVGDGDDLGETDLGHVLDLGRAPHIDPRALDHLCGLPDGSQARRARPPGRTFCRRGRHLRFHRRAGSPLQRDLVADAASGAGRDQRRAAVADARRVLHHDGLHAVPRGGDDRDPLSHRAPHRSGCRAGGAGAGRGTWRGGDRSVIYLIAAYGLAIAVLGGYLAWSLLRVRELSKPHELGG